MDTSSHYSTLSMFTIWVFPVIATIAITVLSFLVWKLSHRVSARESGALVRESRMRMLQGRIETQEALLHDVSQMQQSVKAVSALQASRTREPELTYREAIYLARQGHTPLKELVGRCGVSAGEAELIMRLHGPSADDDLTPFTASASFADAQAGNGNGLGGEGKLQ